MATNVLQFQKNWNNKLAADSFLVITKPSRKYEVGRNYAVYLGQQRLGTAELTAIVGSGRPIPIRDIVPERGFFSSENR